MSIEIKRVSYVEDPEFFKDGSCEYPPCKTPGYGAARGAILCKEHYYAALNIMGIELLKYGKEVMEK